MKLSGYTYVCNNLTSFECEVHTITGNGNTLCQLKLAWENSWKHNKWHYFVADFTHLEPLCSTSSDADDSHAAKFLTICKQSCVKKSFYYCYTLYTFRMLSLSGFVFRPIKLQWNKKRIIITEYDILSCLHVKNDNK